MMHLGLRKRRSSPPTGRPDWPMWARAFGAITVAIVQVVRLLLDHPMH